ncbi:pilus assembly protein CpaB [Gibbsiella quercinecans]|nr:SAF domain-containing protein [Gibbsiella quercinecans]TCT87798.1 pilus assembly protein CpaB [Gibbsiella quercinecans]
MNMKRSGLIVYTVMIVVGILGLFFYFNQSHTVVPQQVSQPEIKPQQTISVAVAVRDLEATTVLRAEDFQIKTVAVDVGSTDSQFNLVGKTLDRWALKSAVPAGSWIMPTLLVEPGSNDYLSLFLKPGNILYTFELKKPDNYLLDNIKAGQGVDIYLSYRRVYPKQEETLEISAEQSREKNLQHNRLKPLMGNKRVLAIRPAKTVNNNGVKVVEKGSQLVVELQDREVKMLKGLGGDLANVLLFPTTASQDGQSDIALPVMEAAWPVSNDMIFNAPAAPETLVTKINELRG